MPVTQDVFNEDGKFMRKIRSFVRREGRLTKGQEKALEELWPVMGIDFAPQPLDMVALFGREAPVVLEIGFGMGASLVEMARNAPEKNFIGIEVHSPGVGACLGTAQEAGVTNLRVICHDAVEVLDGLKEGDAVLLGGAMQAGDRVRARMVEWTAGAAAPGAAAQGKGQGGDAGSALTNAMGR